MKEQVTDISKVLQDMTVEIRLMREIACRVSQCRAVSSVWAYSKFLA